MAMPANSQRLCENGRFYANNMKVLPFSDDVAWLRGAQYANQMANM